MTSDFAQRTRARVAEARAALTKLREVGKETVRHLTKIDKQHASDRDRLSSKLGELADDVIDKLPEAAASDLDRARALQEQINDLAGDVEEISFGGGALEDLGGYLHDTINETYASFKAVEVQLSTMERLATKLGI
jgi:hypothetical protein